MVNRKPRSNETQSDINKRNIQQTDYEPSPNDSSYDKYLNKMNNDESEQNNLNLDSDSMDKGKDGDEEFPHRFKGE